MKFVWFTGFFFTALCGLVLLFPSIEVYGRIKDVDTFSGASWENVKDNPPVQNKWLQSVCTTDTYIVCVLNASNTDSSKDTLAAYYKNDTDEKGNPVEQYSFAKKVTEMDYEHANGMTYNPRTHEILIATGRVLKSRNAGCIFVVDADTLKYKRTIQVNDGSYCYLAIGYWAQRDAYIVRTDATKNFRFEILDADFQITDSFPFQTDESDSFYLQDFCISGDYLLDLTHYSTTRTDNYISAYSLSRRELLGSYYIGIAGNQKTIEAEGICETAPGSFLVGSALGSRKIRFTSTSIPTIYKIRTSVENGEITSTQKTVTGGSDYTITFKPKKHYQLHALSVDGQDVEIRDGQSQYTFSDVRANHRIKATFSELPRYTITTKAVNGTVTKTAEVYEGDDLTVEYGANAHYKLDMIRVDGEKINTSRHLDVYSFHDVTQDHEIVITYKEIASFTIRTSVTHGSITETLSKVYQNQDAKVLFSGDKDYMLLGVIVDGEWMGRSDYPASYTFTNVSAPHTIKAVYIWQYLPFCVFAALVAVVMGVSKLILEHERRKKRARAVLVLRALRNQE